MAASLIAPYRYEAVKPDLDVSQLEPRQTDAELYADAPLTATMSVLYIAVESLRGDLLHRKHQGIEITPNLNALAKRSAVFSRAYAQSTHTDYSVPSYLSSQYPLRSQSHFYYERDQTWPKAQLYEHLHHFGYVTGLISSDTTNWGELRSYLWNQNLDVFFDAENLPTTYSASSRDRGYVTDFKHTPRTQSKAVPDRETVDFDIAWIKKAVAQDQPWFLYTFFYQPHYPYAIEADDARPFQPSEQDFDSTFLWFPPEKIHVMLNAYLNAVHEMDAQLGRLVQYLEDSGQMDSTIIVLTGDHGEAFGEHGVVTHAGPLFEEVVRVPLVIYAPGINAQEYAFPAQHIDAAPTVCGLLGIPAHPGFQGVDLLNTNRALLETRDIYLHSEPPSSWRGDAIIRAGRWKFWHDRYSDYYYLYDLLNDPEETTDLKMMFPELASDLKKQLQSWRKAQLSYYTFKQYYEQYYPPNH
jgi:arylsulfatase A-like enzyme